MSYDRPQASRASLRVLDGLPISGVPADRIALSLVHPRERIDIAISAIRWIEARRYKIHGSGKGSWISRYPFVEICLAPYVGERIYRLTKQIVGESLEFLVNGESISKPVVREPLGIHESLAISLWDYEEAAALANRLSARWTMFQLKPVKLVARSPV